MKPGLALTVVVVTTALAQPPSERRVLYSRVEDLPTEIRAVRADRAFPAPNASDHELKQLARLILPSIARASTHPCDAASVQELFRKQPIDSGYQVSGSFTRAGARQTIWLYTLCSGEGVGYRAGLAITEEGKLLVNFFGNHIALDAYSVRDINRNGLSELLLVVPETGRFGSVTNAVHLYEFPGQQVRPLGALPVGGPPSPNLAGEHSPGLYGELGSFGPPSVCRVLARRNAPRAVISRELYVEKGSSPRFFSQASLLNCDYLENGLHLKRRGPVEEVRLAPFKSPFRRLP